MRLWLNGVDLSKDDQVKQVGVFIRLFLLLLIIMLMYAAFRIINFPSMEKKNAFSIGRLGISVITAILVMFFIPTSSLVTAMQSYSAMGVTLIILFPIFVLGAFTMLVASNANPSGLFIQRIIWGVYSVYLFLQAGKVYAAHRIVNSVLELAAVNGGQAVSWIVFRYKNIEEAMNVANNTDSTTALVLFITAIMVFAIMYWKNNMVVKAIMAGQSKAHDQAKRKELSDADKNRKAESEQFNKAGG